MKGGRSRPLRSTSFPLSPRVLAPSCLVLNIAIQTWMRLELPEGAILVDRLDIAIIFRHTLLRCPDDSPSCEGGCCRFSTKPFADDVVLSDIRQAVERSRCALRREAELQALRACHAYLAAANRRSWRSSFPAC